jgi:hypothetical protein
VQVIIDYQKREIRLTDERLAHILERPEMTGMEAAIREVLQEPQFVRQSRSDEDAFLNYRFYHRTVVGDKWLCVVAKYLEEDAFIVTAYFTDKLKEGKEIWHSM